MAAEAQTSLTSAVASAMKAPRAALAQRQHVIRLDLELSHGHYEVVPNDKTPQILEAAVIMTDNDLNELGRWQWAMGCFAEEQLEMMLDLHQEHFRDKAAGGRFPPADGAAGNNQFSNIVCL